ncbi:MAG: thioredoxin-disulfide reductase [Candidatus Buchananbacteria bacterium]|nr:thioredoxin-disulfide reductase [Candidatus Buchananbacteria bacterium]
MYQLIVIGGGISAHTAALYTARDGIKTLVLTGLEPDQLSMTTLVENFPGFPDGIMGPDLISNAKKQAEKFGAEYKSEKVQKLVPDQGEFEVVTDRGTYRGKTVIISTGASANWLGVKGEKEYIGRGVSACATCDAAFFRDKNVVVVGGGDTAMEESLVLTRFAKHVTIIHRRDSFKASKIMQDRVFAKSDQIAIVWNTEVVEVVGDGKFITGLVIKNNQTGNVSEIKTDGVFVAIGHKTNVEVFKDIITLDERGYIATDKLGQTNIPGVFAAGDVQDPHFKQAITAAGSGCAAALSVERYLEDLKEKTK